MVFLFVDIIDITVHDRFWNVGQANCILKYFENMMIYHSRKWLILPGKYIQMLSISHKMADYSTYCHIFVKQLMTDFCFISITFIITEW
jgi:hypothetical protein